MRKHKFKIWNTKQQKFLGPYDVNGLHVEFKDNNTFEMKSILDDNIRVQHIGLEDINGKEIYENDFVKICGDPYSLYYENNHILKVQWIEGVAGFHPFCDENSDFNPLISNWHTEIIGNVYENPKLCEKETRYVFGTHSEVFSNSPSFLSDKKKE